MPTNPLFRSFIDYAGVFPPASHPLHEAMQRYRAALAQPQGWILGPFLLRASQLTELADHDTPCGLVIDVEPSQIALGDLTPVQVECRFDSTGPTDLGPLLSLAPVVYVESTQPHESWLLPAISEARDTGFDVRAKIRMGGATPVSFPDPKQVAGFLLGCAALDVPFKATAGLHGPFRHRSDVVGATEHGFINLIAAARAALVGAGAAVEEILSDASPASFDVANCTWNAIGQEISAGAVRGFLTSVGSCSFEEPAGHLQQLGALDIPS